MRKKISLKEIIELLKIEDSKHTEENGKIIPSDDFIELEDLLCQKCSPEQIYEIAKLGLKSTNIQKLGLIIIASKDLKLNYKIARYVKGADVKSHGRVIIESKDLEWNCWFAENVKGADVKSHGRVIIESKDPELNCRFARDVEGADVLAHAQVLYKKSQYYFEQLIEDLKKRGISFEYDEKGKPIKVISSIDQILENFDDIAIESE